MLRIEKELAEAVRLQQEAPPAQLEEEEAGARLRKLTEKELTEFKVPCPCNGYVVSVCRVCRRYLCVYYMYVMWSR